MAKKSRLLSVLRAAEDFLIVFDSYFRDPVWVTKSFVLENDQPRRKLNYLKRNEKIDANYNLIDRRKEVFSLVNQDWDELWRVVSYDIPEAERDKRRRIRGILNKFGFKQLQRSVWVSPLAVDEYIKELASENNSRDFCFFVGTLFGQSSKEIVNQLWPVDEWKNKARALLADLNKESFNPEEAKKRFWELILSHPKLPLDLLPFYWPLEDLTQAFVAKING